MTYQIKQWIGALTNPVIVVLAFVVLGLIFKWRRRPAIARSLLVSAALIGYLGSIAIVGDELLAPLENEYPPLRDDYPLPAVGYVVVLGSGYAPHDHVPITAALNEDGLARIVEGVRIARRLGTARLIVSGGAPPGQVPVAIGYAELARGLGVPEESLLMSDRALDTAAEAGAVAKLLGKTPFILVTSAYHMPRAMRLMRRAGANPIPAPTGQRSGAGHHLWFGLLPSSGGLASTERAIHEYLGLASIAARLE